MLLAAYIKRHTRERMSAVILALILPLFMHQPAYAQEPQIHPSQDYKIKVEVLTNKLNTPWGMEFLPDGSMLITERGGTMRHLNNGVLTKPIKGVPKVASKGQGGLLDVAIDPDFSSNNYVYLSFSEPGKKGAGTAVARGKFNGQTFENMTVIYRQKNKTRSGLHFGSRLVFAKDGTLFVTHGDRGKGKRAQDPFDHAGSLIRINKDGSIPPDNPFANGTKALPEIWSIGHRNMQGAAIHPKTGDIWTVEHGARGGDEINRPQAAKNYGWPIISYGRHYSGLKIGEGTTKQGLEQPRHFWDPSIAPSGLAFYQGEAFEKWNGDLLVGSLKFQMLSRLKMQGGKIVSEERLLAGTYGRIRDVNNGPDGAIYLLIDDDDGMLLKLVPAG
ncbi:MAG: PQQ-dependent sugar dehydrogenase [Hyphomicrobiales bacterium]